MGNSQSEQPIAYKTIKKERHPVLGPISIVEVPFSATPRRCLLKHRSHIDIDHTNRSIQWLQAKQNNHACKYILKKIYAQDHSTHTSCSNLQEQEIFYQCFQQDLALQFYSKKSMKGKYSQEQIIKILHDCCLALRLADELSMKIYHPYKQAILKDHNGNYMLILQEDADVSHPIEFYQAQFDPQLLGKNYYLSPQLLNSINSEQSPAVTQKDHVFCLGLTVLSLCLMKDLPFESQVVGLACQEGERRFCFDAKSVNKQADKIKKIASGVEYSNKVKYLLASMLEYDRDKRISAEEIIETVGQFQTNKKIQRVSAKKMSYSKQSQENTFSQSTHRSSHKRVMSTTESKKVIDVYLDARHLFDEAKSKIATDPKAYKNSKINKFKLQNHPHKQAVSEFTSKIEDFTPIKQLLASPFQQSAQLNKDESARSGLLSLPRAQSKYQLISQNSIRTPASKTSIAINMISQFNICHGQRWERVNKQ